jgi:hypothetical protein
MANRTTEGEPSSRKRQAAKTRGRSIRWGLAAGVVGLGCCVYPVVLALLGLASAAVAIDLGNFLYDEWGWAFRLAGAALAAVALAVQWRRRRRCPADARPSFWGAAVLLGAVAIFTYGVLYLLTTALGMLGT